MNVPPFFDIIDFNNITILHWFKIENSLEEPTLHIGCFTNNSGND